MSYIGSKGQAGTFQHIIGQMPPHEIYIEPFAGSAQVYLRKRPARYSVLMDKNAEVLESIKIHPGFEAKKIYDSAFIWLPKIASSLGNVALAYVDPPYLLETRKGRVYYEHELSSDHHASLLTMLQTFGCYVMISGYPSRLYSQMLPAPKWRCLSYRTRTRGATVTECLWCNFPEPAELHDWRFAGRTFRERLSLGRLANRWLAKLERMPDRKRNFVLHSIEQRHLRRAVAAGRVGSDDAAGEQSSLALPPLR